MGSAPFERPEELFSAIGQHLGEHVERVPDGEPGARKYWVTWQREFLTRSPLVGEVGASGYAGKPEVGLVEGADPTQVVFDDLGYATEALAAHASFREVKDAGGLAAPVRFQVSLPTPLDVLAGGVVELASRAALEPAYEAAMRNELARICDAIPHEELAIQWDLALETLYWEEDFTDFRNGEWYAEAARNGYWGGRDGMIERVARMLDAVPDDVETGVHFCYGDFGGVHDFEPVDLAHVTDMATRLLEAVHRPIEFLHMPVPIERSDPEYFAPLRLLELPQATTLYLGLVHLADGAAGAMARIAAAQTAVESFGVATECGWGRNQVDDVPELARIHAAVSDPAAALVKGRAA